MRSTAAPSRAAVVRGRPLATLVALAAGLVVAFVVAPGPLAGGRWSGGLVDQRNLITSLDGAFVAYWRSNDPHFPPELAGIVDYWLRYHVAKAVIAALLLAVFAALGVLLWKAFLRAGGLGAGQRAGLASAGALATVLATSSLAVVMANVQGAVAPFASLLPMLTDGHPGGALAATLDQVRQRLAHSPTAPGAPPAAAVMISDFARYHVEMAVSAAIVAVILIGMSAMWWRRFVRTDSTDRRARRVWTSFGVLSALLSLAVIVLAVANATTAADPAPALLALFQGSW